MPGERRMMANPHARTITFEDDRCHDCDQYAPCDCPCDYCVKGQRETEAFRGYLRRETDAKARGRMRRRGANMDEAEEFKARTGAYPFVITVTGSALHGWDCDRIVSRGPERSMLVTLAEALAWLSDPPYSLPGYHGPRMVCGTCNPALPTPVEVGG